MSLQKIREQPAGEHIELPCGHWTFCDWPRGDRRVSCSHGRWWLIRSHRGRYECDKEIFPPKESFTE